MSQWLGVGEKVKLASSTTLWKNLKNAAIALLYNYGVKIRSQGAKFCT